MRHAPRRHLPAQPLLRTYAASGIPGPEELVQLPGLGPRFRAVLAARAGLLRESFLDEAGEAEFAATLTRFYEACCRPALHTATLQRRAGVVRHALAHLLRNPDPLTRKAGRCLAPGGPYHVTGLGPVFWSALFQGLDPERNAAWTPAVVLGLKRLGLARWKPQDGPGTVYAAILESYRRLRLLAPALNALHVDHFLGLVGGMNGRELGSNPPSPDLAALVREAQTDPSHRENLKERDRALRQAARDLEAGLPREDGALIGGALSVADPVGHRQAPVRWKSQGEKLALWVGRLWEADDPYETLDAFWRSDPIPGAGLWLPAAVLHLKDARQFHPWDDASRRGYALLDDSADFAGPAAEKYRLYNEGMTQLRELHRLHPREAVAVLAAVAAEREDAGDGRGPRGRARPPRQAGKRSHANAPARFGGFCKDTFAFLEELGRHNARDWMEGQRDRYRFAVREPLVELCRALAENYVRPVLGGQWGWDLESAPRNGRAVTSICKNDYGRSTPYNTVLWITFYRRGRGDRSARGAEVQFFVRLDAAGLTYGLRLGREARAAGQLFRRNVSEHADLLYRALVESGAVAQCRFGATLDVADPDAASSDRLPGPEHLRAWVAGESHAPAARSDSVSSESTSARPHLSLVAGKTVPASSPLIGPDELVGDILLTFNRLLPLYACAVEKDPASFLARFTGGDPAAGFTEGDFRRATYLGEDWVRRARGLLGLKRQLILQGVPGTGKTHVARSLARLLTGGRDEAVRLVQFHPAYSYEEFVEGIKARSVEVNGRHDVTYPVEDGLLSSFAAEAARRPADPYVLIVDEINRGNLPRVCGELLYLLEYREQTIRLPYSRRDFRLPANLYLIGTMNAADRSVALVDQALRRRFSFLEMPPDPGVLAAWLADHPPAAGEPFAAKVVTLFERLNARLRADLGAEFQIGHSYFMVPCLDELRLRVVWEHQVGPLLEEYFAGRAGGVPAYGLDQLLAGGAGRRTKRKKRAAVVSG